MLDRETSTPDPDPWPTADRDQTVVAVAVVVHQGHVVVGQRPAGTPLAELWEFPGGKVRPGESASRAAIRECLEEAGLETEVIGSYGVVAHRYPHGPVQVNFLACRLTSPADSVRPPFRWCPVGELDRYAFPAANAPVIHRLTKSV